MNKVYLKTVKLTSGDVVATSYWKMENLGNGIKHDMKFTAPDGTKYGKPDFDGGIFDNVDFYKGVDKTDGYCLYDDYDCADTDGNEWNGYYKFVEDHFVWHHALKK